MGYAGAIVTSNLDGSCQCEIASLAGSPIDSSLPFRYKVSHLRPLSIQHHEVQNSYRTSRFPGNVGWKNGEALGGLKIKLNGTEWTRGGCANGCLKLGAEGAARPKTGNFAECICMVTMTGREPNFDVESRYLGNYYLPNGFRPGVAVAGSTRLVN